MGHHVVAHFLLHLLLTPILISSARRLPTDSVRTIWVSSVANTNAPPDGGINWDDINNRKGRAGNVAQWTLYGQSKAGDIILGYEAAQRLGKEGVVSVGLSPGSLKTGLQRNVPGWVNRIFVSDIVLKGYFSSIRGRERSEVNQIKTDERI